MQVILDKNAAKKLERTNESLKSRIVEALNGLSKEPPRGDIKKLQGRSDYRLRIGDYRLLFRIENNMIIVTNIAPRDQAY